jgi:phosphoglycolate phosphatase
MPTEETLAGDLRGRRALSKRGALLFDFDGTLIHQTIDFALMRRLAEDVVRAYGVDPEGWKSLFVLEMLERAAQALADVGDGRSQAMLAEAQRAIVQLEMDAAREARAFAGVAEMLTQLRASGRGVAIVTRNCRPAVDWVMAQNGLTCDVLLTRDDVEHVKPDPRHLLAALEQLGATGAQAVMVGDHPTDILVGQQVGAATVAVLSPGVGPERFAEVRPDLVVAQVTEIMEHL